MLAHAAADPWNCPEHGEPNGLRHIVWGLNRAVEVVSQEGETEADHRAYNERNDRVAPQGGIDRSIWWRPDLHDPSSTEGGNLAL